jgi:hypothetical protein
MITLVCTPSGSEKSKDTERLTFFRIVALEARAGCPALVLGKYIVSAVEQ